VSIDGAGYCLGAVNRDCWYLYTLNPYATPAGYSLNALLAGSSTSTIEGDDGFGASDGEEGTSLDGSSSGPETEDSGSDDAGADDDSSDDSLTDLRSMMKNNKLRNQRYPNSLLIPGGGGGRVGSESDQTLEIMMSELVNLFIFKFSL